MTTGCNVQLILLGESGVGKTSLLLRFMSGIFKESLQRTRIDRSEKVIKIRDNNVNLTVWDTAGQEMYNSLIRNYYNVADGVLLVYDVRNAETFMTLSKWLLQLKSVNEKAEVLIAGNKIEDRSKKSVNVEMVSSFANSEQLEHVGVSAKSGENVEILFHHLVRKILASRGILSYSKDQLLEKLEKSGEYLSPSTVVPEQPSNSPDIPENDHTDNAAPTGVSEQVKNGETNFVRDDSGISPEPENESGSDAHGHIQEMKEYSSLQESDSDMSVEFIDPADCALEFFDALGEEVTGSSPNQLDIIRLHEGANDTADNKNKCCVIS